MNLLKPGALDRIQGNVAVTRETQGIDWAHVKVRMEFLYEVQARATDVPRMFQIELTNHCNLKCIMCPHPRMTRPKAFMSTESLKAICDNGIRMAQGIELQMFGESTLSVDIGEAIAIVGSYGCHSVLSTNVTRLRDEHVCKRLEGLDAIVLSVDGATKETYERVRGTSFEEAVEAVHTYCKVNRNFEKPTYTALQIIGMGATESDIAGYEKFWSDSGVDEVRVKRLLDSMAGVVMGDEVQMPKGRRLPCQEVWSGMSVRVDGSVSPCGRDYNGIMTMGNLVSQPIEEIWNSESYIAFREAHISGNLSDYPLCQGCKEWDLVNLRFEPSVTCAHFKGDDIRVKQVLEGLE